MTDNDNPERNEFVVVEKGLGPARGYYHNEENGTWMESEKMTMEKAEEEGYSRCTGCFGVEQ